MNATQWPKLSETLRFEKHPESCQSCGRGTATGDKVSRHVECDHLDQPTPVIVVLCEPCAKRIIEPHPRLYLRQDDNKPIPGAMVLCSDCRHREKLRCTHPSLKANGGPGLSIRCPEPVRGFVDGRDPKTGKRTGGYFERYSSAPSACHGREV